MSPKAKQVLFTPQMVAAIIVSLASGGGLGAVTGYKTSSDSQAVMEYRVKQLEEQVKSAAEFDKRLTLVEKTADRFQAQLDRFEKMLDRQAKR